MEETGASDTASDVEEEGNSKLPPRRGRKKSNTADIEEIDASASASDVEEESNSRLPSRRGRKNSNLVDVEQIDASSSGSDVEENAIAMSSMLDEDSKKAPRRGRRKSTVVPSSGGEVVEKKTTRRTKKKVENIEDGIFGSELGTSEESNLPIMVEDKNEGLVFDEIEDGDDISFSYGWPPLVCCFGAAQHTFIPSGRQANRLIDHEMHETMKDVFWSPTSFFRAPGSSSSSVAVALASLGGKVAFMGKLGDDDYGQAMLYYLNVNKVQTRSVKVDGSKLTGVSYMKITRKGGLKITCTRPCAEDSLLRSEINIDVLKEARMFYFNSSSLLDPDMRSTTLQAIHISKKFGGVIFFDLNLPLPLWHSNVETKAFIQEAWNCADIIEVTKQELEFLCGITPLEEFDTKDNDRSKFTHYKREVITPLWHENLKVLFVTNGTSKIHFYTDQENGAVLGMEDPPITPFTCDMSVSGDAIVAALMRMLTVQPHLVTDQGYLKHSIKYAIDCGVIDQWLLARIRGFPPQEEMEGSSIKPNGVISVSEKEHRTLQTVS
ncbi:Fructokinase-2 [Acorus calamus]|uniref:Fructokinase-2 n=1 Tax=Acorus calamus TaxID=4465 RepID=A0AAV9EQP1_ACOCL|nr:Fructokinase-2 [Acorus calamus]